MFIPFAPWDRRAKELIKKKNTIKPIRCAIFLSSDKLLKYDARLSPDGKIVIGKVAPFSDFDAVWYYDDEANCPRRLLTTAGETQFISSIAKCKRIAELGKFHSIKRKVFFDASLADKEIVERIKELDSKFEKKILSLQPGNDLWGEMVSLFTLAYEAREEMKEEEEEVSDVEMKEELPEESPQLTKEDDVYMEVEVEEEEADEVATDAAGMQRRMQFEQEGQDAINAKAGVTSDPTGAADAAGTATTSTVVEPDASDPVVALRVEQFSVIEDVQITLSQKVRQ
eukprot:s4359_g3.t1